MDGVLEIRDRFVQRVQENTAEIISQEVEINDYAPVIRTLLTEKEFLDSLYDLTSCNVYV